MIEPVTFGACPVPADDYERVVLGHGSGGILSANLVRDVFLGVFDDPTLRALEDQAVLASAPVGARLAVTTDGFVVSPTMFPGGDVGTLAVCGTVNDLAVGGARPKYLTAAFILEEGTPLLLVRRVVESMAAMCKLARVAVVAGDTKVVERGKGDSIFITTTGIGFVPEGRRLSAAHARPGDRIIVSGTLGDHGIAVMSVREGIAFETDLVSDVAPLADLSEAILEVSPSVRCMRDPTRGGLASALTEIAELSGVGMRLEESSLPLKREVVAACDLLGLDPLYVASEGRLVAIVPEADAKAVLRTMHSHPQGRDAAIIGSVVAEHPGRVTLRPAAGGERWVLRLSGEQLPRIC